MVYIGRSNAASDLEDRIPSEAAMSMECLMLTVAFVPCDGVTLARLVRAVGLSARRSLNRTPSAAEARELFRAFDSLESELRHRTSGDLSRWLENLRRRVEDHVGFAH